MLNNLLTLSHVPRWVIIDTSKTQTVADHSFRVAAICLTLIHELRTLDVELDAENLLTRAIIHDISECKSGDVPTPHKRRLAALGLVEDDDDGTLEYHLLKVADIVEAITFLDRYGIRSKRVRNELHQSLTAAKQAAWEVMEAPEVVQHGWWNRIVDKILEVGANYE